MHKADSVWIGTASDRNMKLPIKRPTSRRGVQPALLPAVPRAANPRRGVMPLDAAVKDPLDLRHFERRTHLKLNEGALLRDHRGVVPPEFARLSLDNNT